MDNRRAILNNSMMINARVVGMKKITKIFFITGFLLILILLAGTGLSGADTLLRVPQLTQEHSNWCWDASGQATLQYYYGASVSQCAIANWALGRTDCCGSSASSPCNAANYMAYHTGSLQDVLSHWGVNSLPIPSALSQATAVSEILAGRPFVIEFSRPWYCSGNVGHIVVGRGFDLNGQYIDYMDPWPGHGYIKESYATVVSSPANCRDWTASLQMTTKPKPNLTPYKPSTWSDKIVVSKAIGTNTDSSPIYTADTLYVDWAVANLGNASISTTFYTKLYVDSVLKQSWYISSMPVNSYSPLTDYSIGTLSAGLHTIKIVTDATGVITESNEGDNEYTKTITVTSATNSPPVAEAAVSKSPTGPYYGYTTPLTVTKGQSVNLYFFADKDVNGDGKASLDPDGWTNADNGVFSGGKAAWNTDLNQGTPTFESIIINPSSAAAANIGPFTYTFNDAPGTYEYQMLRITDRKGAQSIVSKIRITVVAAPTVTPIYEGWIDGADCNSIWGWAWNKNQPNTSINVDIYDGSTKLTTVAANVFRQDLVNAAKGNGYHGFSYATPSSLKNGSSHSIYVKYAGTSTNLSGTPKSITCSGSINPAIAQSPMSAPSGTTFSEWGTGFTPNSTATLHFRKPDGTEYPTLSEPITSSGSFSISYTAPTSKAPGTYTWWAVDGPTGKVSNSVSYTITVKPVIAQTPMSGPPGTTFSEWGTGFTANSTATLHFRKPDGTEYPTLSQPINSNGTFSISYTAPLNKPKGTYSWWGVDGPTGKVSNTVSYTIN
jgi:hypothetical protein